MMTKALVAALLAVAASPAAAQIRVNEKRPAAKDGLVEIENATGTIRVVGWDREEVAVTGTLGRRASGLDFTGGSRRTHISVEVDGHPHGVRSDLEIRVPAGSRLAIEGFQAEITVMDVEGPVSAESVNGSISVSGPSKELNLETVNGRVEASGPATRVHAESVNGAVTIRGASGEVMASTVNGRLTVTGGAFERGRLETVNGHIRFEGDLSGRGVLDFESVGGSVDLLLPGNVSADFTISSFSGDIQNDFGQSARRVSRYTSEKELTFSTGSGGTKVSIHTLSGDVMLRKR